MTPIDGLVLIVSGIALVVALLTAARNPPETLRKMAREAFDRSHQTQMSNEAFKAECTTILSAVQDEAERASKLRSKARSAQQRAELADVNSQPKTREEEMAGYRERAGLI